MVTVTKEKETEVKGLTEEEVRASREAHGANTLAVKRKRGFLLQLLGNFSDPIVRVLLIALGANMIILGGHCNWFETGGILLAVFLSTLVSTLSEWGSERAFERLRGDGERGVVRAVRDGSVCEIGVTEIVVGDCLPLAAGEMIQADGVMLRGEVHVDQSTLNGESVEAVKTPRRDMVSTRDLSEASQVYRGSLVSSGEGVMMVTAVGGETLYGSLANELQSTTRESPLKLRLARLAGQISRIGYVMAALVAVAFLFNAFVISADFFMPAVLALLTDRTYVLSTLIHTVTLVITVIVVAVPEGLPMMITVVLSSNMRRMLRDHVLVRKMVGIETAGSLNILFTDKTGTLTTGQMSVTGILSGDCVEYRGARAFPEGNALAAHLAISAMVNTDSSMADGRAIGGNATDRAILTAFSSVSERIPPVLRRLPFDSRRKLSAVQTTEGVYVKGAPDILMPGVTYYMTPRGEKTVLSRAGRDALLSAMNRHASQGARLLAVCRSDTWQEETPTELTLIGVILLRDRIRREARRSIDTLHRAGVQVVMVTGDGRETAAAIAYESGLAEREGHGKMLSGADLARMTDEELRELMPTLRVVYRALPQDKSRLVRVAQSMNLVTGMTGDGINDAPSLKLADVGFAMGSGTDIAREAGDIVILDDNIASICRTVLYGRTIFKSIRKFITFQLTMNICAVGVSLVGQFIGIESPVTIIQMLWVNIIMDTLGGLAFAGEAPAMRYMKEKPKHREEPILSGAMLHQIVITGAYTLALSIVFLVSPFFRLRLGNGHSEVYYLTLFFALFIFSGLANCICARSERLDLLSGIGGNKPFVFILLFIACVQVCMIYFGGTLFRTVPVAPADLGIVILLSMTVIPVDFIRRIFYKLKKPKKRCKT